MKLLKILSTERPRKNNNISSFLIFLREKISKEFFLEEKTMNLKVRFKNPIFIFQLVLAVLTPILAYAGLTAQDLTSWPIVGKILFEAIKNPYVLTLVIISIWNAANDPTTAGIKDSKQAMSYTAPRGREVK
jgi:phi LC3 family holin